MLESQNGWKHRRKWKEAKARFAKSSPRRAFLLHAAHFLRRRQS